MESKWSNFGYSRREGKACWVVEGCTRQSSYAVCFLELFVHPKVISSSPQCEKFQVGVGIPSVYVQTLMWSPQVFSATTFGASREEGDLHLSFCAIEPSVLLVIAAVTLVGRVNV